jgi:hypothetical protein
MDLLGFGPGEPYVLERVLNEIVQQPVDDGLRFEPAVQAKEILQSRSWVSRGSESA